MKLDLIDLKILKSLQNNSKITNIELSKVIGLSAAPTLGRVQKLEKAGVLKSYHAVINNNKTAYNQRLSQIAKRNKQSDELAEMKNDIAEIKALLKNLGGK